MKYLVQPLAPRSANGPLYAGNDARIFVIAPAHSGLAVTVVGNAIQLQQQRWQENANQQWKIIANGDGTQRLLNVGTNLVMDVESSSKTALAKVVAYAWTGGNNQRWRLSELSQGHLQILNVNSGLSLDLEGGSKAIGAKVIQSTLHGGLNQHWIFSEVRPNTVVFDKKAILYDTTGYTGRSQQLGLGSWDINQLTIGNDSVSSLRVPAGLRVTLYQDANFRGTHKSYTSDTSTLGTFNKLTSAVVVEKVASFYTEANYLGTAVHLGVGRYDLSKIGLTNDTLSSIKVPHGLLVTLYQDVGFAGDYRNYFEDTPSLVPSAFDNKTSSIVIKHIGVVVPSKALKFGDSLQLRACHDKYMGAQSDGRLLVSSATANAWEQFIVIRAGASTHNSLISYGDVIALKTAHGKYVVAEADGSANANGTTLGASAQWQLIRSGTSQSSTFAADGDTVSLKSVAYNKYAVADTGSIVNANRTSIDTWEKFILGSPRASARDDAGGLSICGVDACAQEAADISVCAVDTCGAAACGVAGSLVGACGAAASGIVVCGLDVEGAGACAAAACGAAVAGIAACGADACGA
ncbi:MAG TPA: RICIN domain-containing protein, partial [Archangium sp.]|nr:RICIN domain-containing protein [Archangium sp.]